MAVHGETPSQEMQDRMARSVEQPDVTISQPMTSPTPEPSQSTEATWVSDARELVLLRAAEGHDHELEAAVDDLIGHVKLTTQEEITAARPEPPVEGCAVCGDGPLDLKHAVDAETRVPHCPGEYHPFEMVEPPVEGALGEAEDEARVALLEYMQAFLSGDADAYILVHEFKQAVLAAARSGHDGLREALFQQGEFTLSGGQMSTWKVECDALTPADWRGLARIAMERWDLRFDGVVGVPSGGNMFAGALFEYTDVGPTLVVDDVLTTGGSMRAAMADHPHSIGLVAFARGPLPPNVKAIWHAAEPPVEGALEEARREVLRAVRAVYMGDPRYRKTMHEPALEAALDALITVARAAGPVEPGGAA